MWGLKAAAIAIAALAAPVAQAATVDLTIGFEDNPLVPAPFILHEDTPGIQDSNNCGPDKPCLAVNSVGAASLSITNPQTFSVVSFFFSLQGEGDNLIVTTNKGTITLLEAVFDHNGPGQTLVIGSLAATLQAWFTDISQISFITNTGTARIDDLAVSYETAAAVPLPATGILLMAGMGGLAALRRRKKT